MNTKYSVACLVLISISQLLVTQKIPTDDNEIVVNQKISQPSVNGNTTVTATNDWTYYDYVKVAAAITGILGLGAATWYNKDALANQFDHIYNYVESWLNRPQPESKNSSITHSDNQSDDTKVNEITTINPQHSNNVTKTLDKHPTSLTENEIRKYQAKMIQAWGEKFGKKAAGYPLQPIPAADNQRLHREQSAWINNYLNNPNNFDNKNLSIDDQDKIARTDEIDNLERFSNALRRAAITTFPVVTPLPEMLFPSIFPTLIPAATGLLGVNAFTAMFLYNNVNPKTAQESMDATNKAIEQMQLHQ